MSQAFEPIIIGGSDFLLSAKSSFNYHRRPIADFTFFQCSKSHQFTLKMSFANSALHKLLLMSQVHLFDEGFSPPENFCAVVLNYLRTLTINIGVDEPGRPRRLDCLPIIDPEQQRDCQTRPCWSGSNTIISADLFTFLRQGDNTVTFSLRDSLQHHSSEPLCTMH
jgi:hypothetical protein